MSASRSRTRGERRSAIGDQTTLSDRKRRAGQRLVLGISGPTPTQAERRFITEAQPGGFILFKHNVEEPAQVRELNRELGSLLPTASPPLLAVDQEGGRVQRIRETDWPRARWLGNVDDPALTGAVHRGMADELRALGFNLDFAPVADVDSNPQNPVIGDRSFSDRPDRVVRHLLPAMQGLHERGVISCIKHFPGHGDTALDSHLDLPVVEKELPDLERCELVPFRAAIEAGAPMVMAAHVRFPMWDEEVPATMSSAILDTLLRGTLRFDGVLCSDDMEMKAVRGRYPLERQLDAACRATVDLFVFSHELELAAEAWELLVKLQEADGTHDQRARDSARRLVALRERFLRAPPAAPGLEVVGRLEHRMLATDVASRGRA